MKNAPYPSEKKCLAFTGKKRYLFEIYRMYFLVSSLFFSQNTKFNLNVKMQSIFYGPQKQMLDILNESLLQFETHLEYFTISSHELK